MSGHWRGRGIPPTPGPSPTRREGGGGEHTSRTDAFGRRTVSNAMRVATRDAARVHRKNPTPNESLLWEAVRGGRIDGYKFRRQQPIGPFIVDFYCSEARLVIEVDGPIHLRQQEQDADRQECIESLGIRFLRLTHDEVIFDLTGAIARIRAALESSSSLPPPSPLVGEGPGVGGIAAAALWVAFSAGAAA